MDTQELAIKAVHALKEEYPDALCSLDYEDPLQLLISVRLAAQCTDARVNLVTPALFERFPTLEAFCEGTEEEIGELIHSCGFFRAKARDILGACRKIRDEFGGRVPDNMEDLLSLPGVGRKTANLILGDVYHKPAVVTDTHCIRISGRLGLTKNKAPEKVERDLRAVLPPEESNNFCHRLVLHGRAVCIARRALCEKCCMKEFCRRVGVE
ncbi:MAG: endonuclease III [Acutalibacter muris]|nr:endonuclease III [Acutalibacter muris]MCI9193014.1 endonuclease III [Acutalibacter muris]